MVLIDRVSPILWIIIYIIDTEDYHNNNIFDNKIYL